MIKTNFTILLLFSYLFSFAQENTDIVISATTSKNVTLFFPTSIKTAIVGSTTFSFGFNKETNSKYGILKAIPGQESNLLITTENGNIFSFIIRYAKDISNSKLNHFISDDQSIGNESGIIPKHEERIITPDLNSSKDNIINNLTINDYQPDIDYPTDIKDTKYSNLKQEDKEVHFKKIADLEINKLRFFKRFYAVTDDVYIQLKNIHYNTNELYFTIIIFNNSSLDYDINYLNFYLNSRKRNRNTTTQTLPYKPVFQHNVPKRVKTSEKIEVVFVFDKFSINKNKIMQVELTEINGERNVLLEIPNNYINKPN